jgi:outer membrane lipoprotein-sorting protein
MNKKKIAFATTLLLCLVPLASTGDAGSNPDNESSKDAKQIIQDTINHYRGLKSYSEIEMTIHRPDWQRTMGLKGWSSGGKKTLVRVISPPRDSGNATLVLDDNKVWSYSPKINRVIRIPSSMMSQSWMGSDFSNKDISRTDEIVNEYTHKLLRTETENGHKIYVIESVPLEESAIVWGKEISRIRDDYVELNHQFLDQEMRPVKLLETLEIREIGGRMYPVYQRMKNHEKADEWTSIRVNILDFDREIPDYLFTLSNLRNPREQ